MKKCPFCAEEIQDAAIKCKHCGEFLTQGARAAQKQDAPVWYYKTSFIITMLSCVGPFALPLIWFRPKTTLTFKIISSVIIFVVTGLLVWLLWAFVQFLTAQYQSIWAPYAQ